MHQYAYVGRGKTIHYSPHLEHYGNDVNDKSVKTQGGLQRITTLDGYVIPLDICNGLPYIKIRPYTSKEWDTLPHVILTSDVDWDPSVLDYQHTDKDDWYEAVQELESNPHADLFNEFGE